METHDLGPVMPRLAKLAAHTRHHVSIDFSVWVRPDGTIRDAEWTVWDGETHHKSRTPAAALDLAEMENHLGTEYPDGLKLTVITPATEEDAQ